MIENKGYQAIKDISCWHRLEYFCSHAVGKHLSIQRIPICLIWWPEAMPCPVLGMKPIFHLKTQLSSLLSFHTRPFWIKIWEKLPSCKFCEILDKRPVLKTTPCPFHCQQGLGCTAIIHSIEPVLWCAVPG